MPTQYPRLARTNSAACHAPWATKRAAILCLMACVALFIAAPHAHADASASALREDNIVSPGKAARDPHAFGPVEDLTGAVLADEVPARDATGQVELVGSVGVMPKVPRAEVGGVGDGESRDAYATTDFNKSTTTESGDSSRSNPVFWITLSASATLGLLSLYTLRAHRQEASSNGQIACTQVPVPTTELASFLGPVPARSRSPTKGTRLDSGFISGRSALLAGNTVIVRKVDTPAESEGDGEDDLVGTANATVLGQDELQALDLN